MVTGDPGTEVDLPVGVPAGRFDWSAPLPPVGELGRVHLVAIGGAGMSAVARLLHGRGVTVTGSDSADSAMVAALRAEGMLVHVGHDADHLRGVDTVVVSSAIREDNVELAAARRLGLRVLHRAQALAVAVEGKRTVAIAGANGKTTTTAMVVTALRHAGLDPTYAIGGELVDGATNAHLGAGDTAVLEADESDGSFVVYRPEVAVVTSVQPDHLDVYGTVEAVEAGYRAFVTTIRPGGLLVVCSDDPGAARLGVWACGRGVRVLTYGRSAGSSWQVGELDAVGTSSTAVVTSGGVAHRLALAVPGWFNVLNGAAALAACCDGLGVSGVAVLEGLAQFAGTRRRFERKGSAAGVVVVDDYAHNPAKVAAVVDAGRGAVAEGGRLVVCFQPHLYSRTRDFATEFGQALAGADEVVVLDVYAAREDPIPGVSGRLVADAVEQAGGHARFLADQSEAPRELTRLLRAGDLLITVGAGDITRLGPLVLAELSRQKSHLHDEGEA